MSSFAKCFGHGLVCCATLVGAQTFAQTPRVTLGDYIATQRAVLEAEVLKVQQSATQSRNPPSAVNPQDAKPTNMPPALLTPPPPPEPKPVLLGIMTIGGRPVAEVGYQGRGSVLSLGQQIPGTAWRAVALTSNSVTLQRAIQPSTARGAIAKVSTEKKRPESKLGEQASLETLTLSLLSSAKP